jgi:hypothetical protein
MSMVVRHANPVVPSNNNLEKGKIDKDSFLVFIHQLSIVRISFINN